MHMRRITLENLLSFGPGAEELETCSSQTFLIGAPTVSGKSNLIEAISLLRACTGRHHGATTRRRRRKQLDLEPGSRFCRIPYGSGPGQ